MSHLIGLDCPLSTVPNDILRTFFIFSPYINASVKIMFSDYDNDNRLIFKGNFAGMSFHFGTCELMSLMLISTTSSVCASCSLMLASSYRLPQASHIKYSIVQFAVDSIISCTQAELYWEV